MNRRIAMKIGTEVLRGRTAAYTEGQMRHAIRVLYQGGWKQLSRSMKQRHVLVREVRGRTRKRMLDRTTENMYALGKSTKQAATAMDQLGKAMQATTDAMSAAVDAMSTTSLPVTG